MTNDETGAALPGDSYARMKTLLGVEAGRRRTMSTRVAVTARRWRKRRCDGYAEGEKIRSYS